MGISPGATHNLKVAGSNPAPAPNSAPGFGQGRFLLPEMPDTPHAPVLGSRQLPEL